MSGFVADSTYRIIASSHLWGSSTGFLQIGVRPKGFVGKGSTNVEVDEAVLVETEVGVGVVFAPRIAITWRGTLPEAGVGLIDRGSTLVSELSLLFVIRGPP